MARRRAQFPWVFIVSLVLLGVTAYGGYRLFTSGVLVPQVTGLSRAEATKEIQALGLYVGKVTEQDSDKPRGTVLDQLPKAGIRTNAGATVDLSVARPKVEAQAFAPTVTGVVQPDAVAAISAAGLRAVTFYAFSDSVDAGQTFGQFPAGGQSVLLDAAVGAVVSLGPSAGSPDAASVPDLSGAESTEAVNAVRRASLVPERVFMSSTKPVGTVIGQLPEAGATSRAGELVGIFVSAGAKPVPRPKALVTVPDLHDLAQSDALIEVQPKGLQPVFLATFSKSTPVGQVTSTYPAAGASVPWASPVLIGVSAGPPPAEATILVPNVIGATSARGATGLQTVGLVGLTFEFNSSAATGTVLGQIAPAGTLSLSGARVGLAISNPSLAAPRP